MHPGRLSSMIVATVLFSFKLMSQEFGGNPPSLKWKQINNDTVRVIFPIGLEKKASDVTALILKENATTLSTIGSTLRKVNIVMQNQTTTANGYVSLGPFRSEFFLTPNQNSFELGSLPWHKTLAMHEYRHVQQFNNFRKGLSKTFYILFGEEGQALANNLAIPDYFWEGDAVYQETLLSNQGRGRIPYFFNPYRSVWSSGKNYSWMKMRNGSYRDMIPDHYHLGYMMVAYGREKYGDSIWRKVTDDASRFKGLFYPFQKSIKKYTGKSYPDFRNEAISYFKENSIQKDLDTSFAYAKQHTHFVSDKEFPQWKDAQHLVYVKTTYSRIPAFYSLNIVTGKENKIRTRDISQDNYFSFRNNRIIYAAYSTDPRWGWRNYGILKLIDTRTGKQQRVTSASKYFSPDISADGKTIVAVNINPSGENRLHLIETSTGKIISEVPNTQNMVYTYPKFYTDQKIVSAVRNENGEMALGLIDITTGDAQWLTPFSAEAIGFPQVNNDTITFSMTDGKQDKMFAVVRGKLNVFEPNEQNTSTSDYQLSTYEGKYSWISFTSVGYKIVTGGGRFTEIEKSPSNEPNTVYALNIQHSNPNYINDVKAGNYPVTKYPGSFNLFNFHSWRPYISDPDYSYSLISENILNTFQSELTVAYNRNEHSKQLGASVAYAGMYPVISAGVNYTIGRFSNSGNPQQPSWNEFTANAGVSVPLNFNSGFFYQSIIPKVTLNKRQVYFTGASKDQFSNLQFNYGEYSILATNQVLKARQNIYPRFAQTIFARYRSILSKYTANQFLLNGSLYFPGFSRNHSIVFQMALQQRDTLHEYNFSNSFPGSRGYTDINYPLMWMFNANYHFPLFYPDAGVANIVYLLRVRASLYYDHTIAKSLRTASTFMFRSTGVEIFFDTKWWNQLPVNFGIRYSHLLDPDAGNRFSNRWEFVLPLNLLSR
ncbi:MAG: hypothetical protein ABI415_05155 [Flavitalea sp.]